MANADVVAGPSFHGLSVWLCPAVSCVGPLEAQVRQFAADLRGSAAFSPHMTVVGGFSAPIGDAVAMVQRWAAGRPAMDATVANVAAGSSFFMSVFATFDETGEAPWMALNADAQKELGLAYAYVPHVSLAYGAFAESDREAAAATALAALRGHRVTFDRLELWDTSGEAHEWKQLAAAPLAAAETAPTAVASSTVQAAAAAAAAASTA